MENTDERLEEVRKLHELMIQRYESAEKSYKIMILVCVFVCGLFAVLIGCFICYFVTLL